MRIRYGFDESEWKAIKSAVADTVTYVSKAETGKINPPKELIASATYLTDQRCDGPTAFVRGLSAGSIVHDEKWPAFTSEQIEPLVMESIGLACDLVAIKQPEELELFGELLMNTARASVSVSTGQDDPQTDSLKVIERAVSAGTAPRGR